MVDRGYLKWQLRRGKLELDVVLQRFIARYPLETMGDDDLVKLERLLQSTDDELLDLFLRRAAAQESALRELVEKILAVPVRPPG